MLSVPGYNHRLIARFAYRFPLLYDTLGPLINIQSLWQQVAELTEPQPGERVLDACCGTGHLAILLHSRLNGGGEVVGLDHSPYMLGRANNEAKASLIFVRGDAEHIPYPDGHFDRATLTLALHEMPAEARGRVLAELKRVTKKRVVLGELYPPKGWWNRFALSLVEELQWVQEMRRLAEQVIAAGFRVRTQEFWGAFQTLQAEV